MRKVLLAMLMNSGISLCLANGMGFFGSPGGLLLNPDNTYAFTLSSNIGSVVSCRVQDGAMSNCKDQVLDNVKISWPERIVMNTSGDHIFITNQSANIAQCSVSGNQLINCSQANYAADAIGIHGNQAYLFTTKDKNSSVMNCSLNAGEISNCVENTSLRGKFTFASVITINPAGTWAYISNTDDTVYSCKITNQQISNDCVSNKLDNVTQINGITLSSNADYVFLGNMMNSGSAKVNNGSVQRCKLNSDGTFTECGDSGATHSATTSYFFPEYIAISNDGRYAFINNAADSQNLTRCDISNNTFQNCNNAISTSTINRKANGNMQKGNTNKGNQSSALNISQTGIFPWSM
ncbi:MAG: hypothetical protein K2Y14_14605 [Burkholderiales bacterium]|nr:hypothetical protein [Burkholderiales bacterium]